VSANFTDDVGNYCASFYESHEKFLVLSFEIQIQEPSLVPVECRQEKIIPLCVRDGGLIYCSCAHSLDKRFSRGR
jgi:hypothetical protein